MSLYSKHTGRNQAVRTELKPDVWKLAYLGVKKLAEQVRCNHLQLSSHCFGM